MPLFVTRSAFLIAWLLVPSHAFATVASFCGAQVAHLDPQARPRIAAYRVAGDRNKPVVVLLHGFQSDSQSFRPIVKDLARDYYVIAIDQVGHGATPAEGLDYSSERLADHVRLTLVTIGLGDRPLFLLGHSLGARTATVYAARYPQQVKALVLEDMDLFASGAKPMPLPEAQALAAIPQTFPTRWDATVELSALLGPDARMWVDDLAQPQTDGSVRLPFHAGAWYLRGHQANAEELGPTLAQVRCPVTLFQASEEKNARLTAAGVAHARRYLPGVRVVPFDAYHTIHADKPDEWVREARVAFPPR